MHALVNPNSEVRRTGTRVTHEQPIRIMKYASLGPVLLVASLAAVLFGGCSAAEDPRTHYERSMELYGFDFTKYDDFLITPEGYSEAYESVGILRVVIWPEMGRTVEQSPSGDKRYGEWFRESLRMQEAVDSLHVRAERMGADAIIRFDANRVTEPIDDGTRVGVQARGFAIDRE